jgi:hypothetical protein
VDEKYNFLVTGICENVTLSLCLKCIMLSLKFVLSDSVNADLERCVKFCSGLSSMDHN